MTSLVVDVKFFENIFPFKDSVIEKNNSNIFQDINHINFFDIEYPEIPNDDERVNNNLNRNQKSQSDSSSSSVSGSNVHTADFPVDNPGNDADSSDDFVATQNEKTPRQWNAKLATTLIENGFSQSKSDYYLYTKSDKGVFLTLLVCVDDIIITGNSVSEIEKFKVYLKSKFMIKDLGKLKYFLGIEVVDTEKGICLNQRKYGLDLLSEYGMLACKPANTPSISKLVVSNEATKKDPVLENVTDYQMLMGKLIYLTNTRPAISYDVHCLRQFMHSPLTSHL
ncbi:ribonuclease H-like domain-containing protein, partial [Tanacetum coccineum]